MTRDQSQLGDAPDHPVLLEPWAYSVCGVKVDFHNGNQLNDALVLDLVRGSIRLRLRFEGVSQLEIDAGFPYSYMGLEILDVTHLQWDGIAIRVDGFEPSPGIRFWARCVTLESTDSKPG